MPVDVSKLVDVEKAKLESYASFVTLNARNELYFNPNAMATLDRTTPVPTEAVGYEILSDDEIAIYFVEPGTDQSVDLKRPDNKRTGRCSFTPILIKRPFLKVRSGRVNRFPFRLDLSMGAAPRFVISIARPKVRRSKSKGSSKKQPASNQAPGLMPADLDGEN